MEEQKHVAIWIRVSTQDQAQGESPKIHEKRARSYAELKEWTVKEVYDLSGVSGKTVMEHPTAKGLRRANYKALVLLAIGSHSVSP